MPIPATFHPLIRRWFSDTYGEPTAVQAEAWPLIEKGENVLALAPTGSGKTLTAFLSAISRFCPSEKGDALQCDTLQGNVLQSDALYPHDKLTVLYISPLKALNEDINRNLLKPLEEISRRFKEAGLEFPPVRVETRSGDTPQVQRRRFLVHPPSILALTPESLAILLVNPRGRQVLSSVKYLILDEIHAVLGNKRGAFLSCQIERLAGIAGEFQRISLSATVSAPQIAAEFAGGIGCRVRIVSAHSEKKIELKVKYSESNPFISRSKSLANESVNETERQISDYGKRYSDIINYILEKISSRSTILVFTDSRRRCERLCYFINREYAIQNPHNSVQVAFTHHGSLSKELRRTVEQRFAAGTLPCVVATSSLELGIDIGSVDEVILAGCPLSVSQALQRIGRAGHGVGKTSYGCIFPFHGLDLLASVAMEGAVNERDIEEIRPIENPLDILAQIILALCAEKSRKIDPLYAQLKTFGLFKNLNKNSYIRTVRMLAGLGEKTRLREIKPRIALDEESGEITALQGILPLLYSSGGVITSRGLYSLRLKDGTKIGELDEEFVWERRLGDCFDFGGRGWRIASIGNESVEAVPLGAQANFIPFWKADTSSRSSNLSGRILSILDNAVSQNSLTDRAIPENENPASGNFKTELEYLDIFLGSQRAVQGECPLPGSYNIAIETINNSEIGRDFFQIVLHSFRGLAINYPMALALAQELEEKLELRVECFSDDNSILLVIPRLAAADSIQFEEMIKRSLMSFNTPAPSGLYRWEKLLRGRLESTGLFGAAFREAAERSLLLPRAFFGKRCPLWITRQRSKRLFDAVIREENFPITQEAWRCCLKDNFDMEGLGDLLSDISDGTITLSFFRTENPSPFAENLVRQETNAFIYEYDERKDLHTVSGNGASGHGSLSDRVILEALQDSSLRPALKPELVAGFVSRLRREIPGWTAEDELSLSEWVKERIAIPLDEWEILVSALPENLREKIHNAGTTEQGFPPGPMDRIKIIKREGAAIASVVHREWEKTWKDEALTLLGLWLRYEGPISILRITEVFGTNISGSEDAVSALAEENEIIRDITVAESQTDPLVPGTDSSLQTPNSSFLTPNSSFQIPNSSLNKLICDRENLDMLLRLSRRKQRPEIRELPSAFLAPFLALRQGIVNTESKNRGQAAFPWKKMTALPAPAKLWETEFFTARDINYRKEMLDKQIDQGNLVWFGMNKQKTGFCSPMELDLLLPLSEKQKKPDNILSGLFMPEGNHALWAQRGKPEKEGASIFFERPRDFWEIKEKLQKIKPETSSNDCVNALWEQVWQGKLSSDSFEPVRLFIEEDHSTMAAFEMKAQELYPLPGGRHPKIPRALRDRWKSGAPVTGRWFSLEIENEISGDPLDDELLNRDRVRLLVDRYGILCRPLLEHEAPCFSWSSLLPAMRRMELAGELIAGRFFAGINSLQFTSPAVLPELEKLESMWEIYWMNAADPASPAGLGIEGLSPNLPERSPNNRIFFRGAELIAVSSRSGKELQIYIDENDADMKKLIELFKFPRTRNILPEKKLTIEKINGEKAASSCYAGQMLNAGFIADRGKLYLW